MLLVLCQQGKEENKLRQTLRRLTAPQACDDELVLEPLPPANAGMPAFIAKLLRQRASATHHLTVLATPCVALDRRQARLPHNVTFQKRTIRALEHSLLRDTLAAHKLDLKSVLSRTLAAWFHWEPTHKGRADLAASEHINRWLWQFDRLGTHGWVGERLLRALQFYTPHQLVPLLNLAGDGLRNTRFLCVNRHTPGKSSDVVANLARKAANSAGLATLSIEDFYHCLESSRDGAVVFAEDCLMSGTEMTRLLQSLFGEVPSDRTPKSPALSAEARAFLPTRSLELRFAVSCNLGVLELERYLQSHGLHACTIRSGTHLETLTEEGVQAFRANRLIGSANIMLDPDRHINMVAFSDEHMWRVESQQMRAIEFCRTVGRQLWTTYLDRKGWKWSPDRIEECALGMRGQALAVAFAHSVPKSTLPLFWMDGDVHYGARQLHWRALFPNAA